NAPVLRKLVHQVTDQTETINTFYICIASADAAFQGLRQLRAQLYVYRVAVTRVIIEVAEIVVASCAEIETVEVDIRIPTGENEVCGSVHRHDETDSQFEVHDIRIARNQGPG